MSKFVKILLHYLLHIYNAHQGKGVGELFYNVFLEAYHGG